MENERFAVIDIKDPIHFIGKLLLLAASKRSGYEQDIRDSLRLSNLKPTREQVAAARQDWEKWLHTDWDAAEKELLTNRWPLAGSKPGSRTWLSCAVWYYPAR